MLHATVAVTGSRLWMSWMRRTCRRRGLTSRITLSPSGLLRLVPQTIPTGTAVQASSVTLDLREQFDHGGLSFIEFSAQPLVTPGAISPVHVSMGLEVDSGRPPMALRLVKATTVLDTLRFGG